MEERRHGEPSIDAQMTEISVHASTRDAAMELPFAPSDEWSDALETQCTEELISTLGKYAAFRARGVSNAGGFVDDYYINALVQDALTDTAIGVLRWDPEVRSLELHVRDAIRARTSHDRQRARQFPHESVDVFAVGAPHALLAEIETSLAEANDELHAALTRGAADRIAAVREGAARDPLALQLLEAAEAGATTRAQVMRLTGMSNTDYHNARARLARLVAQPLHDA